MGLVVSRRESFSLCDTEGKMKTLSRRVFIAVLSAVAGVFPKRISTPDEATAFAYKHNGHVFYTLPGDHFSASANVLSGRAPL